jgi:hypothetical protein
MRRIFASFVALAAIVAVCGAAHAQYGDPYGQPQPQPAYGPPRADASPKPVSGFLGPRLNLELMGADDGYSTLLIPELEGGIWIKDLVEIYLGFGTIVYGVGTKADDDDNSATARYGNVLLQLGARFHITKPRPGHAFLYTGLDFTWVIGVGKYEAGGETDDAAQNTAKEQIDRFGIGAELGVELLVTENFGIGAESGLRVFINNLMDTLTNDEQDAVDHYREAYLEVPFGLRFMYHF